jgi:hypothetical protein
MTRIVHARFDGEAFYPEEPLPIPPNTTVLLTVETPEVVAAVGVPLEEDVSPSPPRPGEPYSFLKYATSLRLEGPEDWSENLDEYLYRGKKLPDV